MPCGTTSFRLDKGYVMKTFALITWYAQRVALAATLGLVGVAHGQMPEPLVRPDIELVDVGEIQSVADQPHYGLLIAGTFTRVNGETRNGLARMAYGNTDPNWNPNPSWLGSVPLVPRRVKMSPDGGVFVSGDLVEIAGHGVDCIVKLKPDGQLDTAWTAPTTNCDFDPVFDREGWMYFIDSDHSVRRTRLDVGGSADPYWTHWPANGFAEPYKLMLEFGDSLYVASKTVRWNQTLIGKVPTSLNGHELWSREDQYDTVVAMQQSEYGVVYLAYAQGAIRKFDARNGSLSEAIMPNPALAGVRNMKLASSGFDEHLFVAASGGVRKFSTNGSELASYPHAQRDFVNEMIPSGSSVLLAGKFSAVDGQESQSLLSIHGGGTPGPSAAYEITGPGKIEEVVAQPNGGAIVRGSFIKADKLPRREIFRLTPEGIVDPGWSVQANDAINHVVIGSDSTVYIGGSFTNIVGGVFPLRFLAKLDAASGSPFSWWGPSLGLQYAPLDLAIDAQDRVYVAPPVQQANMGMRRVLVTPDGEPDQNWGPIHVSYLGGIDLVGDYLYLQSNQPNIIDIFRAELVDGTSGPTGWYVALHNGISAPALNAISADGVGNLLLGGRFEWYGGGDVRRNLLRLDSVGGVDESWLPQVNGGVNDIAVDAAGEIYIAGDFTTVGTQASNGLARLSPIDATPRADWMPAHGASSICVADVQRLFVVGDHWRNTFVALPLSVGVGGEVPAIERN